MPRPIEVSYVTKGKSGRKERDVTGVMCPKALNLCLGAKPIFVSMGDVQVDWSETSEALETLLEFMRIER